MGAGLVWVAKSAFGTQHTRTVALEFPSGLPLLCHEYHSADLAAVFYTVKFAVDGADQKEIHLGQATFHDQDWASRIMLLEYDGWYVVAANEQYGSKVIMYNAEINQTKDTVLSPLNLRSDSLWKQTSDPLSIHNTGTASVDSIVGGLFYVSYAYRIGHDDPFEFYTQTIAHQFDLETGLFDTRRIFDRIEK